MKKILFVSAATAVVGRWQKLLRDQGYEVDAALSGTEAMERSLSGKPRLVVVDQLETSRDILIRSLAENPATAALPVLTLTPQEAHRPEAVLPRIAALLVSRRVLVAEDDRQMASILEMMLARSGYEVRTVYDGLAALRELKAWHPHLLVLDIMLPVMDGFHICQTMNDDPSFKPRPKVLIVSGRSSEWDQNLGTACGAEDYIVKPFNNAVFLEKVRAILALG